MSPHARLSSFVKQTNDRAVSRAYSDLAREERPTFTALLDAIRTRSTVRVCPAVAAALRNLARFGPRYLRPLADWPGARGTMYPVVDSLAQHLLARYRVPRFLASVWYGDAGGAADTGRRWFIDHAAGMRFRDLDLPAPMTRHMEALFLGSPDHLGVAAALRRAELVSLGAREDLVNAVLATRLGSELANGAFWRTVIQFFVRWSARLEPSAVGPIVDFVQYVRHQRPEVVTGQGVRFVDPPDPSFSVKGRSLASMQRLVEAWLVELTSSAELRAEGVALRHCVASYAHLCALGRARIWSLRRSRTSSVFRPVATIEIDPRARAIVQARGMRNGALSRRARELMVTWARRENIDVRA